MHMLICTIEILNIIIIIIIKKALFVVHTHSRISVNGDILDASESNL